MRRLPALLYAAGLTTALLLGGCGMRPPFFAPTRPASDCPVSSPERTEQDIAAAEGFGEGIFSPDEWQRATGVEDTRITVEWRHLEQSRLVYLEYLRYECGYTAFDLREYFSESSLEVMLAGYERWEETARCQADDLTLIEAAASLDGQDYRLRVWHRPVSATRVLALHLTFPADDQTAMDELAEQLFGDLPACP